MIARITEVRMNSAEELTLVANFYETDTEVGKDQIMYSVSKESIDNALLALGLAESTLFSSKTYEDSLYGIDVDEDANGLYLLLKLLAGCSLGPNAELPCQEVKGVILELSNGTSLHIETNYDDKYVVCYCAPSVVKRYHEIFKCDNLTNIPGFYYHKTGEAYLGYRIK